MYFSGYTVTWLDDDLVRHIIVLGIRRFFGRQTYDRLAEHISGILTQFLIDKKCIGCTTDGATNYGKAFRTFHTNDDESEEISEEKNDSEPEEEEENDDDVGDETGLDLAAILDEPSEDMEYDLPEHFKCSSHRLNLVGKNDIKLAENDPKFMKIANSFSAKQKQLLKAQNTSTQNTEKILKHCGSLFIKTTQVRWNSDYDSMKDLNRKIEKSSDNLDGLLKELKIPKFTKEEILYLKEYVQCLKPIAIALDDIQGDNVSLGHVLPMVVNIRKSFQDVKCELQICKPLINAILGGVEKRFNPLFQNKSHILASVTNPMFKTRWIWDQIEKENAIRMLRKEYDKMKPKSNPSEKSSVQDDGCNKKSMFYFEDDDELDELEDEVNEYLKCQSRELKVLHQFPIIKKIYKRYNTNFASSASVERLFSECKRAFGDKRHKLLDSNFEKQVMLKRNKAYY